MLFSANISFNRSVSFYLCRDFSTAKWQAEHVTNFSRLELQQWMFTSYKLSTGYLHERRISSCVQWIRRGKCVSVEGLKITQFHMGNLGLKGSNPSKTDPILYCFQSEIPSLKEDISFMFQYIKLNDTSISWMSFWQKQ